MSFHSILAVMYRSSQRMIAKKKIVQDAGRIANIPSYYPEMQRKPYKQRLIENRQWAEEYGEVNVFYTLYGFDLCKMEGGAVRVY